MKQAAGAASGCHGGAGVGGGRHRIQLLRWPPPSQDELRPTERSIWGPVEPLKYGGAVEFCTGYSAAWWLAVVQVERADRPELGVAGGWAVALELTNHA